MLSRLALMPCAAAAAIALCRAGSGLMDMGPRAAKKWRGLPEAGGGEEAYRDTTLVKRSTSAEAKAGVVMLGQAAKSLVPRNTITASGVAVLEKSHANALLPMAVAKVYG
jgi:hypothetical protein